MFSVDLPELEPYHGYHGSGAQETLCKYSSSTAAELQIAMNETEVEYLKLQAEYHDARDAERSATYKVSGLQRSLDAICNRKMIIKLLLEDALGLIDKSPPHNVDKANLQSEEITELFTNSSIHDGCD